MTSPPEGYAKSAEEFGAIRAEAEKLFTWGAVTPAWVFTAKGGQVDFFDYTAGIDYALGPALKFLVSTFGDETLSAIEADLDELLPLPKAPWYWPAFTLPAETAHSSYADMLNFWGGDGVGSIYLNSDLLYVFGSSRQWGICGDRRWDMGILWTKEVTLPGWHNIPKSTFCVAKEAIEYFAAPIYWPNKPPADEVELFLKNYEPFEIGPLDHS
jgi:hypothetical protein